MKFVKFRSIENLTRTAFLKRVQTQALTGGEWAVTEKVHGGNFSLWFDGTDFKMAKRSSFLGEETTFFGADVIKDELEKKTKVLWENLSEKNQPLEIAIFGEMFGGFMFGKKTIGKKIQKGIAYCPDNKFMAFDVVKNGEYLSVDVCNNLLDEAGFFKAETLFRGTFDECVAYPNQFNSKIWEQLTGEVIEEENICEGVVIRPVEPKYLKCGSRVIIKNKNEKWTEKAKAPRKLRDQHKFTEDGQKVLDIASMCVTENRLRNVLSKFEKVTNKDFSKIMKAIMEDIMEELHKDEEYLNLANCLENTELHLVQKSLGKMAASLIGSNFTNIIDGEF